jgi:hypothetical protein
MNKGKKNDKKAYACCDEETKTCESCDFEDSIKVDEEE